jgi:hypothetical protein
LRRRQSLIIVEERRQQRRRVPVAQRQRDEQKLWLILFQLKAIRARINSLAVQYFAFSFLAIIILGAAIVLGAALAMSPLGFLLSCIIVATATFFCVIHVTRTGLRSAASPVRAASLADDRGGLKGRLLTVLLLSNSTQTSELWRYLVEDTYGRRSEFEPGKIEPQWVSRSIFALAGACIMALLLMRVARWRVSSNALRMGLPNQVTAELGNLDIRPADPALEPNAEIFADAATMQKLADKFAAAQGNANNKGGLSHWLNKARNLADELQSKITGQQHLPPVELRLADTGGAADPRQTHQGAAGAGNNSANQSATGKPGAGSAAAPTPGQTPGQLAQNGMGLPGQLGSDVGQANSSDLGSTVSGGSGVGDGVSHGSGSDPEHLFGPPSSQPLGSDSFKITIDAQPSDESSTPGAPAYIPPRVKAPLNDRQHNDEPIARASVPSADQMTIKRVFER